MARKARKTQIEEMVLWLERETTDRIRSKAGRLIDALQARAILDAREITAELSNDLDIFGTSETRSTLSELSALLASDRVFSNCDRLSYLLLDLEHRLSATPMASVASSVLQGLPCERPFFSTCNHGGVNGAECDQR